MRRPAHGRESIDCELLESEFFLEALERRAFDARRGATPCLRLCVIGVEVLD